MELDWLLAPPLPETMPRQRVLYHRLRDAILSGRLAPGTSLPASRRLAVSLQIARNTVLFAYEQLLAEGCLEADRQGTRVAQLVAPLSRYGIRRKVVESTVVHDASTATKVLLAQAARYGQPSRLVRYTVPMRWGWLRRGDLVTLTDIEVAASYQVCLVESVTWTADDALTLALRYVEAGA